MLTVVVMGSFLASQNVHKGQESVPGENRYQPAWLVLKPVIEAVWQDLGSVVEFDIQIIIYFDRLNSLGQALSFNFLGVLCCA